MQNFISVIIPTYNGERTIGQLLTYIVKTLHHYTSEIIIIDSGSRDRTLEVIDSFKRNTASIKVIKIPNRSFNHGGTRNLGVSMASGEYVFFFSQDVLPVSQDYFRYAIKDIREHPKTVAVFGKNIPYPDATIVQKVESDCRWDRVDKFINKQGVLFQSLRKPFTPYKPENYLIWYFLGNTASCFKRSFLLSHPFPEVEYGEDILIGKAILKLGYEKVYDTRCAVYHSHKYNLRDYYRRQKQSLRLRYKTLKLKERGQLICKLIKIMNMPISLTTKIYSILELAILYFVKGAIMLELTFRTDKETIKT